MAHDNHTEHHISYGYLTVIWLALLGLTSLTVAVAGIDLGSYTLFAAMLIAAIKSALVINIFMHIKFEDMLFKFFLVVAGGILLIVFVLTSFDVFYRG